MIMESFISYFEIKNSCNFSGDIFLWNTIQGGHNRYIKNNKEVYFKVFNICKFTNIDEIYNKIYLQKKQVESQVRIFFNNIKKYSNYISKYFSSNIYISLHIDMVSKILVYNDEAKMHSYVNYYIYNSINFKKNLSELFMIDCQNNLLNLNFESDFREKINNIKKIESIPLCNINCGNYDIVLQHSVSGLLAHELVGHLAEQDLKENFYIWVHGKKLSEKNLTVINDPTIPNFTGSYLFDDEGIKSKPTTLISNGFILGELNNLTHHNTNLNGNARTVSYNKRPLVRMGNTYIKRGITPENKILNSLQFGVILYNPICGGIDYKTNNCIIRSKGLFVDNGKIIGKINDLLIYENVFNLFNKIEDIGDKILWENGCWCVKNNQKPIAVKYGGPILKLKNIKVITR